MTDTNEQKWREEFEQLEIVSNIRRESYKNTIVKEADELRIMDIKTGYLAARKKAHSENEDAFKAFTLDLADRYEKEIELLKAELKAERLQNDKTLEFIDEHDHVDISWFPLDYDLEETVKNRRIVL